MITLFHHPFCPHSRFVRLVLGEYGLDSKLVEERVWERREDFLKINPDARTPVLIEEGRPAVLEVLERRVDRPVEDITFEQTADHLRGVDADGLFEEGKEVIHEDGERRDVIHVRVRDDDITHRRALIFREADGDAPGVYADAAVHHEAAQTLLRRGAPLGVDCARQEFDFHMD